jgi:hypothetical protein
MKNYFKEIEGHSGTEAAKAWDWLNRVLYVFSRNRDGLLRLVEDSEENRNRWKIALDPEHSDLLTDLFNELYRAIFNYLAAQGALVDQSRENLKRYKGTDLYSEYSDRIDALKNDMNLSILKELRNMAMHHAAVPFAGHLLLVADPPSEFFDVRINTADLLKLNDWNVDQKKYLEGSKYIGLRDSIESYSAIVVDLYSWLFSHWPDIHAADLEALSELNDEAKAAFGWEKESRGLMFKPSLDKIHV